MYNVQLSTLSYATCLTMLFLCILFLRIALTNINYIKHAGYLIRIIGVLPGFVGVIYGAYLQFILNNPSGWAIMSGCLLLEIGSVQLLYILKKYKQYLDVKSEPVVN